MRGILDWLEMCEKMGDTSQGEIKNYPHFWRFVEVENFIKGNMKIFSNFFCKYKLHLCKFFII